MAYIQFVPDLFLEVAELQRFTKSLDADGFRKALLEDSVSFGLIKSDIDPLFTNGKVERDTDNALGQKTIKIGAIQGIDSEGQFIVSEAIRNLPVPADSNWYWIRVKHQFTSQEKGKVSIDASGNLVGVGTEFTKILRGQPNFPSTVKFINSSNNVLEYEVLEVTDDTHAVLVYPGINGGDSEFLSESNLYFQIVGTFTQGVAIDNDDKFPFKYDSSVIELVLEVTPNVRPSFVSGQEFFLARVSVQIGNLLIQDKRIEYWESKGSKQAIDISRVANPLIGIEAVKWQNIFNGGDKNIVQLAWGMRSTNWSVDSSQNIVTMFGSSTGGSFKTTDDFTNGDFNGWRLYSANGRYRKVISSIKQGSAINLYLDVLDIDDYSNDGGTTFTGKELLVVPNADEVEVRFTADPTDSIVNVDEVKAWPINTPLAEITVTAYKDDTSLYNVQYRYKAFKEFTAWTPIVSGQYYTEVSFKDDGTLVAPDDRVVFTYTSQPVIGFVQVILSPDSLFRFKNKVYKGDVIGVQTLTSLTGGQILELKVGVSDKYQYIKGTISLTDDVFISLSNLDAVEGNEFTIHLNCTALSLGSHKINIVDNLASGTPNIIKVISAADVFQMLNQEDGIAIRCTFDDVGHWIAYQNYNLGQPFELKMIDVSIDQLPTYFDTNTLQGKSRGYFGWALHSILNGGRVPVGYGTFTDANGAVTFIPQTYGGEAAHVQTEAELAAHNHRFTWLEKHVSDGSTGVGSAPGGSHSDDMIADTGQSSPMNILQPYYVTVFVKKTF
jgi:hypothetical protein